MQRQKDIGRVVTRLFKNFLVILEDLQEEHRSSHLKLLEQLPEQYKPLVYCVDTFDDRKMEWLRKRVLDLGNEAIRESEEWIEITFKFKQK